MSESGSEPGGRTPGPALDVTRTALAPLERLAGLPVGEHVAVFEEVFAGLESALASVDDPTQEQPAGPAGVAAGPGGRSAESHDR
jgi:hypothetical protein